MLKIRIRNTGREWFLVLSFYLLLLQTALASKISLMAYVDECYALLGVAFVIYNCMNTKKLVLTRTNKRIIVALFIFVMVGLLGNVIYRYQPVSVVLTDLFANLKFFLCMITGYYLVFPKEIIEGDCVLVGHARFAALSLFVLLLIDLAFEVFGNVGTRYGLRQVKLFYSHQSYLAGAAVFLLAILTLYYKKKNNVYIVFSLVVLFFTLRGKALAGVAVYCVVFFFVLHQRKKIRWYHIVMIGVVALLVAWDQFSYYYIEFNDESARAQLTKASFQIMKDYFPIGTGFGTFASNEAAKNYSSVYFLYGLNNVYGLKENSASFASDTFWPIIIGQTGLIGTVCYVFVLLMCFLRIQNLRSKSINAYAADMFIFVYLIFSSTSESAFCNAVSVPLAITMGTMLTIEKHGAYYEKT